MDEFFVVYRNGKWAALHREQYAAIDPKPFTEGGFDNAYTAKKLARAMNDCATVPATALAEAA